MHPRAVIACHRLGHEGGCFAIGMGHVLDDVFIFQDVVALFGQCPENQAQFMLTGRHFVVMLVHFHPDGFHGRQHFRPQVLGFVNWVHREVAALVARAMAHIAHLELSIGVPCGCDRVNFVAHFVWGDRVTHIIEDEEFGLWAEIGHIANPCGFQIGLCLNGGAAWVTLVRLARVRLDHVTMHAQGFLCVERINIGAVCVYHQFHVGGFDAFPTRNRGAVKHEALIEEIFINQIRHHGNVLDLAARVCETNIDICDVFVFDQFKNLVFAHRDLPLHFGLWGVR